MSQKNGKLSIHSENIFPIIKKWLYSDHDIFIRELTSNAADAITKLKHLVSVGEAKTDEDYKIKVIYDKDNQILKFEDNGLGMDAGEVDEYINSIAFSGAEDFVKKFKDKGQDDQIIGHFGLGFYSAFMVAEKVTIDSLSYKEGAEAVYWECDGGTDYKMDKGERSSRGTTVSLYFSEDGDDFKNEYKIKNTLNKYCNFMPYPIYFETIDSTKEDENLDTKADSENENNESTEPKAINTTKPLYLENPSSITEEQYREFYRDTFVDFKEPLFWIHLNMEYPFRLKGILYFPKIGTEFTEMDGQIKLYNTQVYVADNIKEVIPEFLMLLKGVIDCPDLPLNVSRSFLQNDGFVKKISDYISKKVSDKLVSLFKTDRENYEKYWDDIQIFIKYGILKEDKFYSKVKDAVLYKNTEGKYKTISDISPEEAEVKDGSDNKTKVYYSDNTELQSAYIDLLNAENKEVIVFDERIDSAFMGFVENEHSNISFKRVDSSVDDFSENVEDAFGCHEKSCECQSCGDESTKDEKGKDTNVDEGSAENGEKMSPLSAAFAKALGLDKIKVEIKKMKSEETAALIILSEESRRMADMLKMYSAGGAGMPDFPMDETLVLNNNNQLVKYILDDKAEESKKELFMKQIYDLAQLNNKQLNGKKMQEFIKRSQSIMAELLK